MIRIPFARHPIVRLGRDNRIYYGWTDNLEIEAYSLEGERLHTIRLPSRPIALTDAELKEAIEERGGGRFGGRKVQALKQIELPKTRPAFNDLVIGEGQVWIKVPDRLDSLSTMTRTRSLSRVVRPRPRAGYDRLSPHDAGIGLNGCYRFTFCATWNQGLKPAAADTFPFRRPRLRRLAIAGKRAQ